MGRLNIRGQGASSPNVGGIGGGGYDNSAANWAMFGEGMGGLARGLKDLIRPNWRAEEAAKEVSAVEKARNDRRLEYDKALADLKLKTWEQAYDIRQRKMAQAQTAAEAKAIARATTESVVRMAAYSEKVTALNAMAKNKASFDEANRRYHEASARRQSALRARTEQAIQAATYAYSRVDSEAQRLTDGDFEAVPWSGFYRKATSVVQRPSTTTREDVFLPDYPKPVNRTWPEPTWKDSLPKRTLAAGPEKPASSTTATSYGGRFPTIDETAAAYGEPPTPTLAETVNPRPSVPTSAERGQAHYDMLRSYVPRGSEGGSIDTALRAVAGVPGPDGKPLNKEDALGRLSGAELAIVRKSLGSAEAAWSLISQRGGDTSGLAQMLASSPDAAKVVDSWGRLMKPTSDATRQMAYRVSEDLGRLRAEFIRPSHIDVEPLLDEFLATLYRASAERNQMADVGVAIRKSLATDLARTMTDLIAVGGDGSDLVDHANTYLNKMKPEVLDALTDQVKVVTAAVAGIGQGGTDLQKLTGNVGGYLGKVVGLAEALIPQEMKTDREAYFAAAGKEAQVLDGYIGEIHRLTDFVKSGRMDPNVVEMLHDGTGRLYDITVGPDGGLAVKTGRYLDERLGPSTYGLIRGVELFNPRPDELLEDATDRILDEVNRQRPPTPTSQPSVQPPPGRETLAAQPATQPSPPPDAISQSFDQGSQMLGQIAESADAVLSRPPVQTVQPPAQQFTDDSNAMWNGMFWSDWKPAGDSSYSASDQIGPGQTRYVKDKFNEQMSRMKAAEMGGGVQQPAAPQPAPTMTEGGAIGSNRKPQSKTLGGGPQQSAGAPFAAAMAPGQPQAGPASTQIPQTQPAMI